MQPLNSTLKPRRMPIPKTIACDVDGTLKLANGDPHPRILAWLESKRDEGYTLTLWSMRGADYAKEFAERCGIAHLFAAIVGKPGYVLDDQGWTWTKWTSIIPLAEFEDDPDAG